MTLLPNSVTLASYSLKTFLLEDFMVQFTTLSGTDPQIIPVGAVTVLDYTFDIDPPFSTFSDLLIRLFGGKGRAAASVQIRLNVVPFPSDTHANDAVQRTSEMHTDIQTRFAEIIRWQDLTHPDQVLKNISLDVQRELQELLGYDLFRLGQIIQILVTHRIETTKSEGWIIKKTHTKQTRTDCAIQCKR